MSSHVPSSSNVIRFMHSPICGPKLLAQHDHRLAVMTYRPIFPSISSWVLFRLAEMQQVFPAAVGTVRLRKQ